MGAGAREQGFIIGHRRAKSVQGCTRDALQRLQHLSPVGRRVRHEWHTAGGTRRLTSDGWHTLGQPSGFSSLSAANDPGPRPRFRRPGPTQRPPPTRIRRPANTGAAMCSKTKACTARSSAGPRQWPSGSVTRRTPQRIDEAQEHQPSRLCSRGLVTGAITKTETAAQQARGFRAGRRGVRLTACSLSGCSGREARSTSSGDRGCKWLGCSRSSRRVISRLGLS